MKKPISFAKKKEIIIIFAVILLLLIAYFLFASSKPAAIALVSSGSGSKTQTQKIELNTNRIYNISAELPVTLQVSEGSISFINVVCKDHTCEKFGKINRQGQWAFCAPAQVMVAIN